MFLFLTDPVICQVFLSGFSVSRRIFFMHIFILYRFLKNLSIFLFLTDPVIEVNKVREALRTISHTYYQGFQFLGVFFMHIFILYNFLKYQGIILLLTVPDIEVNKVR